MEEQQEKMIADLKKVSNKMVNEIGVLNTHLEEGKKGQKNATETLNKMITRTEYQWQLLRALSRSLD